MRYTNKDNLPEPVYQAILNRPYNREGADISVTGLINPPRVFQMVERMGDSLEQEASESLAAFFGSAMHTVFQWAAHSLNSEDWVIEHRFHTRVLGWNISGQVDLIQKSSKLLQDYKTCSRWVATFGAKDEWEQQLNVYRWMASLPSEKWPDGLHIDRLEVFAWFKDWSKENTLRDHQYPRKGFEVIKIPTWTLEKAKLYVEDRVRVHQAAALLATDHLPLCTEEERWQKAGEFAVMVGKEKRSRRNVGSKTDALQWMAENLNPSDLTKARIDGRPSEPKRCRLYCPVRFDCDYGKKWAKP